MIKQGAHKFEGMTDFKAMAALMNNFDDVSDAVKSMKIANISDGMIEAALSASRFSASASDVAEGLKTISDFSLKGGKGLKEMGKNLLSMGKGLLKTIFTPKNLVKGGVIGVLAGGAAYLAKKTYDSLPSVQSKKLDKMQQSYDADAAELPAASFYSNLLSTHHLFSTGRLTAASSALMLPVFLRNLFHQ